MIRRPPTVISLNDEELQCHLQHAFLLTLPADFNQLHLEDGGQSDDGHTFAGGSSEDSVASLDSDGEFDFTTMLDSTGGSSCVGNDSSSGGTRSLTALNAFSSVAMTASLHQPPEPDRSPATANQLSTLFPRSQTWRSRELLGAMKTSRRKLELYRTGSRETKKPGLSPSCVSSVDSDDWFIDLVIVAEHHGRVQAEALDHDARHSASQIVRLLPDFCSELAISSVPLQGLILASKQSYEAVLADTASPSLALDATWEFGAVQPDLILEESGADRVGA